MSEIDWEVVNNGMDFLSSTVALMGSDADRDRRFAALHLFAAIETLVKARLAREHWAFVVTDIDRADRPSYETGDFKSVGAVQALERLRALCNLQVSDEVIASVRAAEKLRNRVAHFALQEEHPRATEATLARGLHVLLQFIGAELLPGADGAEAQRINETLEEVRSELGEIGALVRERMQQLRSEIDASTQPVVLCPGCDQPSLVLRDGEPARCLYCFYERAADVAANEYVATVLGESHYVLVKDGGEWPIVFCWECHAEALVQGITTVAGQTASWGCFACGVHGGVADIDRCSRCGVVMPAGDGLVCGDCTDWYLAQ